MKKSPPAPLPRRAPSARLRAAVSARTAAARPRRVPAAEPKDKTIKSLPKSRVKTTERRDSASSVSSHDTGMARPPHVKQPRLDALRSGRSDYAKPRLDFKTRNDAPLKTIDESSLKMPIQTYETFDFAAASTSDVLFCALKEQLVSSCNVTSGLEHLPAPMIGSLESMQTMESLQNLETNLESEPIQRENETRNSSTSCASEAQRRIPADVLKKLGRSGGRRRIKYLNYKNRANGAAPFGGPSQESGDAGNINFVRLRTGTSIARCNSLRGTAKAPAKSLAACHQGVYRMLQPVL